ncbi:hypothetical protein G7046_g787 [Stylonectria norvegica]|nr:hypothetical protein G7046_g787 [Stylonectria norvegica]
MKVIIILSLVAFAFAGLVEKRVCAGDNCKRQVTGTRAGLLAITSRQADCSSFMQATVVPDVFTTTVTVTVGSDDVAQPAKKPDVEARGATQLPTAIPAYASSCTNAVDYSAACSCWGIRASTTTVPQVTSTATITVTVPYCDDL